MVPTIDLERKNSLQTTDWLSKISTLLMLFTLSSMEKVFRLLTLPILNLRDVISSNNIQQMELKKIKECVVRYVPHLLAVLSDTMETNAHSLWSTKEGG
ncbi:hypothetical protein AVEN_48845-1 [Araneus ventricosus]|uniref:Uncharacterized protein n=1 Tax=Araneus ventricosus TaxID=182803 RepID=A0A4Y2AIT7_ARAVE|nr:hypothetical protein AVEN_48845-1 [Araneus ventricosus]